MSTYANVLQNRFNRRHLAVTDVIRVDRDEREPEVEETPENKELREKARKEREMRATKITSLKRALKINDTIAALLSMTGLVFAFVEYEDYYGVDNDDGSGTAHFQATATGNVLRSFVSLTTMVLIIFLFSHSKLSYEMFKVKNSLNYHSSYMESKFFKFFIVEFLINIVHCPPGLDQKFATVQLGYFIIYSLDGIAVTWMLLRSYLVFRLFALYTKWTGPVAEACCAPEGCEANTIFAIKAVLKDRPYTTIFMVMIVSIAIFGLAVRNFERPVYYNYPDPTSYQDYTYIWNGMWLIAVTMTTVGYGDMFPKSHLGRFIAVMACFWGVFLVSMMVVTLTVSSSFETKEAKAYDILFRLSVKEKMKDKAARAGKIVIQLIAIHKQLGNKQLRQEDHMERKIELRNQLTIKLEEFKQARALLADYEVSPEELLRQLTEKIDRDFEEIKEILLSITAIEGQLEELEKSQQAVMGALNECMVFTSNMQNHLIKFKQTLSSQLTGSPVRDVS